MRSLLWVCTRAAWALPLLAAGSALLWSAVRAALAADLGSAAFLAAFALPFGAPAGLLIFDTAAVLLGRRTKPEDARSTEANVSLLVLGLLGFFALVMGPQFRSLLRFSSEGAAKGNLGALRQSYARRLSEHDGAPPAALEELGPLPFLWSWGSGAAHPHRAASVLASRASNGDTGAWGYDVSAGSDSARAVFIDCTHTDNRGASWNSY
jgi:hypothetical protein